MPKISPLCAAVALLALGAPSPPLPAQEGFVIEVVTAVTPEGAPTELWLDLVRRLRSSESAVSAATAVRRPLADGELAWERLIRSRVEAWQARRAELARPFQPVALPGSIRIVLGNRGAEDAFTHDPRTIGLDLSRLVSEYGAAASAENRERIDRFFAHEFTYLLQKAWLAERPLRTGKPYARAELGMWLEGLGNYYSLSGKWRSTHGIASPAARAALAELEPVLVAHMAALACASEEDAAPLLGTLSMGPFTRKWGALPVALWLEAEASADTDALTRFVQMGPTGVHDFVRHHLPPTLAADLDRARTRAAACLEGIASRSQARVPGRTIWLDDASPVDAGNRRPDAPHALETPVAGRT